MDAIIVLLVILGLLLLGMIFLIIWEIKRRNDFSVIAHFITSDKTEERKRYKKISEKFEFKEATYFYDDKCSLTRGKSKHIFYIKNHSAPIDFTLSNDQIMLKYDSVTIDKLLKNNIIQKMLDDVEGYAKEQEKRLILYLLGVCVIILFGVNMMLNKDVAMCSLYGDNQTINIIKEAVKQGIRG